MATRGRKTEAKSWDSRFRHIFNTSYLTDPDLHVLVFMASDDINIVIREALRDYMVKHNSKALNPEFQAKVFMLASLKTAKGMKPCAPDILAELDKIGDLSSVTNHHSPVQKQVALDFPPSPPSPTVITQPNTVPQTPVVSVVPAQQYAQPIARQEKQRIDLDFGPEPEPELAMHSVSTNNTPLRNKWLQNHQY